VIFSDGLPLLLDKQSEEARASLGPDVIDRLHSDIADSLMRNFNVSREDALKWMDTPLFGGSKGGEAADAPEGGDFLSKLVSIEREQVHGKGKNYAVQNVGGWAVMFLLFAVSGSASSLLVEKREDLFVRLLSGPATRGQILWSKFLSVTFLGFVQLAALFAFGHAFFHIFTSAAQLLPLAIVILAGAMACSSIGLVMASFCKTEAQANGLSTLVILTMCSVGGAMFPLFMLPAFVQDVLAPLTPVFWTMDGCFAVLWRDAPVSGILRHVGALMVFTVALMPLAMWRFRSGDLFR
jgi:ABC-2 type transport system permease protein